MKSLQQAVATTNTLPVGARDALLARLDRVPSMSHKCGYGIGDDMDSILARHTKRRGGPPCAENPDFSSDIAHRAALPETDAALTLPLCLKPQAPQRTRFRARGPRSDGSAPC